jgi:hypothetical protein
VGVTSGMTVLSAVQTAAQVTTDVPPGPSAAAPISEFRMGAELAQNAISTRAQHGASRTTACRSCPPVLAIAAAVKMACQPARVSGVAVTTAGP